MLQKDLTFDVITVESHPDCTDFRGIYEGLKCNLLLNPSKGQVRSMLREHPERPLILNGHGTPNGLLNKDWNGYVVDRRVVDILRKRSCIIGVWCYASEFADKYDLKGFFTSMFISTQEEAVNEGFTHADPDDITKENQIFAKRLNRLCKDLTFIDGRPSFDNWILELQRKADITKGFVRFNYEAMTIYK